jgi:hypothetical protein
MPSRELVNAKLTEMLNTLLSGDDERFLELQAWIYCLAQSQWLDKYEESTRMDILGAVYFYQFERRVEAGSNSRNPYFLFYG